MFFPVRSPVTCVSVCIDEKHTTEACFNAVTLELTLCLNESQEHTLSTRAVLLQVGQSVLQRRFAARNLLLVGLLLAHETVS